MRRTLVIGLAALVVGCAGGGVVPSRSLSGRSGSIAWEVRDVARNATKGGWDYMIVLTEQAGIPIQFQRQEVGALAGDTPIRPLAGGPFSRTLDSRDRILLRLWSAGPEAGEAAFVVWRRFTGEDPAGRSVVVDVRFRPAQLQDPGRSTASRGAPSGSARPSAERLKELDALRQQRLITEQEYETARTRILQGL